MHLNLHKEHGKTAIQKVIDNLVAEGKLKIKLNGKQSCYFANQGITSPTSTCATCPRPAACLWRRGDGRT